MGRSWDGLRRAGVLPVARIERRAVLINYVTVTRLRKLRLRSRRIDGNDGDH